MENEPWRVAYGKRGQTDYTPLIDYNPCPGSININRAPSMFRTIEITNVVEEKFKCKFTENNIK